MSNLPSVTTGTITIQQNTRILTGTGTVWRNANTLENLVTQGDIAVSGIVTIGIVDTVDSANQITLLSNYTGTTLTNATYRIIRNTATMDAAVLGQLQQAFRLGTFAVPLAGLVTDVGNSRLQARAGGTNEIALAVGAQGADESALAIALIINSVTRALGARGPFGLHSLTTTQRDALGTVPNGTLIYNSTTLRVEMFEDGAWRQFGRRGGDTMTGDLIVPGLNVSVGDIVISRTTDQWGYIVRPNSAGHKRLQLAVVGGGPLDEFRSNATNNTFTGDTLITHSGDNRLSAVSTGTVQSAILQLVGRQASANSEWNIVSAGSGLSGGMLRFVPGGWTGTPAMVLTNASLAGFGTTSPVERLDVAGNGRFSSSGNDAYIALQSTASGGRSYTIGSGAAASGGGNGLYLYDVTAGLPRFILEGSGHIRPGGDNSQNLGNGSFRWGTVFAGTGTINTSDANEKQDMLPITDALLDKWAGVEAISYRFKDAVARKGDAARTHFGYTAQQVLECMGEDAWTYALLCKDQITKPVKRTVKRLVQKTEAKPVSEETVEIKDGVPTIVVKTREVQEPVVDMVQVIGADGRPVMVERQIEVDGEPDKDGKPTRTTQTITEPRLHPVPVMIEAEVEETVDEPAGDRLGLRYDQCAVIEAAWARRELSRALSRIAALEAA
jgi:hypothetical protein